MAAAGILLPLRHARARRDFSQREFDRALARNRLRRTSDSLIFEDEHGRKYRAVPRRYPYIIARRATLAKILREQAANERASEWRAANGS